MAKRIFHAPNWSAVAVADTTTMTNAQYMAVGAGSSTQLVYVSEIQISGLATSSAPSILMFARDSTLAATPTALAAPNGDGPMHPSTAALAAPAITCVAATTNPQRSSSTSQPRLELGLNAFGGIVRWVAYPGEEWGILSQTQPLGESSLSAFTGSTTASISAHIVYEPF